MRIHHAVGVEGARAARGVVVVIDVLRAFTVSAYAFAGGARECLLVKTVDEARELAAHTPGAVLSAEVDGLPVPGIAISNSPTQMRKADVRERSVIQRSSSGTQAISAVPIGQPIYAASLVVARATAQACLLREPEVVTLVASADYPEDYACAGYIESMLTGAAPSTEQLLQPLFDSPRYRELAAGGWPGFPANDLELALVADVFDFAMPAVRSDLFVRLTKQAPQTSRAAAV